MFNLTEEQQQHLLALARESIRYGLENGVALPAPADFSEQPAACFVTLHLHGDLRGCIGQLEATEPLATAVVHNAFNAAFRDPRFAPLSSLEFPAIHIDIAVLGPLLPIVAADEKNLLAVLQQKRSGVVLKYRDRRATFLPAVWRQLPEPVDFLAALKRKAGLQLGFWSDEFQFFSYDVQEFAEPQTS